MSDNLLNDSQAHKQENELAMNFLRKKFLESARNFVSVSYPVCSHSNIILVG
jgi:hypothetical protein